MHLLCVEPRFFLTGMARLVSPAAVDGWSGGCCMVKLRWTGKWCGEFGLLNFVTELMSMQLGEPRGRTHHLQHARTGCWQRSAKKKIKTAFLEQLLELNSRYIHLRDFKPCLPNHIHLFSGSPHLQTARKKQKKQKKITVLTSRPRSSVLSPVAFCQPPNSQLGL